MNRFFEATRAGISLFLIGLMLLLASCKTAEVSDKQAIQLFDGVTLNGWKYVLADPSVKMDQVWRVEGGLLKCSGTPIGALYKGPAVTNFHMVVEYRWAPGAMPGNSGIFSRIEEPVTALPRAIEVQLKHGNAGEVLGLQGKPIDPNQPRAMAVKDHPIAGRISGVLRFIDAEGPPGQWNRVEILARGPQYTVWMNGKLVNDVFGVEVGKGMVGVQSEGGEVHFRKIELTPLDL